MATIGNNTTLFNSFSMSTNKPIDDRFLVDTMAELLTIPDYTKYSGMQVYVTENNTRFKWNSNDSKYEIEHVGFCSGSTAPNADQYASGDIYINTTNGDVYYKEYTSTTNTISWSYKLNIIGPKGDAGDEGIRGPRGSYWYTGNTITGGATTGTVYPNSGISQAAYGDMYINDAGEIYNCTLAGDPNTALWVYTGVIITGPQGEKGSLWYSGTGITGNDGSQSLTFPNSGVAAAALDDYYLNTTTGNVYKCTKAGPPATATWIYTGCILGPEGPQGETGDQGETGATGLRGSCVFVGNGLLGPTTNGTFTYPPIQTELDFDVNSGDLYLNSNYGHIYQSDGTGKANAVTWNRVAVLMGSKIYVGTAIDGISGSSSTYPSSGIEYSNNYDIYINTDNGSIYMCTKEGKVNDAIWGFWMSLMDALSPFRGASSTTAGETGLVPAPTAGADNRYLSADGTWKTVDSGSKTGVDYLIVTDTTTLEDVYNEFNDSTQKVLVLIQNSTTASSNSIITYVSKSEDNITISGLASYDSDNLMVIKMSGVSTDTIADISMSSAKLATINDINALDTRLTTVEDFMSKYTTMLKILGYETQG